ncbi:MAG: FxLYD domain-containing protein [Nitrososphaerota archaeon]|nr:FxLYD domain-containing protein [Nitrososphaerota archaeon]
MKKITVYLLFLLFVLFIGLFAVSSTNAQISNIKVLDNYSCYSDSVGFLVVVAEIQNIGSNTISSVMIGGTLTLSDGSQTETIANAWVTNLIPQQKAPVYLEFSPPDSLGWGESTFSKVDFQIFNANPTSEYLYSDVVVVSDQGIVAKDGTFWVEGTIKNTGNKDAKDVRVVATFFNAQGQVTGVGYTSQLTPNPIEPSQTTSFKVGAFDVNQTAVLADQKIDHYTLMVQVTGTVLQGTAPAIPQTPTPGPILTENPTSANNPNQPQTINPTNTYIAIVVVVAIVIIVAIFLIKKIPTKLSTKPKTPKPTKK